MNEGTLPRIALITAEAPHTASAGAVVLQRLFAAYPSDRLLVVTSHLPPSTAARLSCRYLHVPLLADRLLRTRFWSWRNSLRTLGATALLSGRRIDQALGEFQPDIVATLMQDSWYYEFAARFARRRRLPLTLFIHDLPDGFEPVAPWLRNLQHQRDARIYRQAAMRFCISESMRDHFEAGFGVGGDVLPPPRAEDPVAQPPENCARLKQPGRLTLGYAGGLHYGYGEQLLRMLPSLRATSTRVILFCPPPGGKLAGLAAATDTLQFRGRTPAPDGAWRGLLAACDAALQPYLNPPGEHARQYRTHFPSKLGECLSLGLPLLVTGPTDASGMAWCLQRPGCAMTVTEPGALASALIRLRDDAALRVTLARRAQTEAAAFDAAPLRARLYTQLSNATVAHKLDHPDA